jgi:DNA sulfur modification protein DndD
LTILAGKLEEVKRAYFNSRNKRNFSKIIKENSEKIENFIELLFNRPPDPENFNDVFQG